MIRNEKDLEVLNDLAERCYMIAAEHGFHAHDDNPNRIAEYISNLHGEVSELWEAYRAGSLNKLCDKASKMKMAGCVPLSCAEEEIADILIRVLDTAVGLGVDVAKAVWNKSLYNETRSFMHGKIA